MIDVVTTATIRPEILDRTLGSFTQNMLMDFPKRLIINIDPVGTGGGLANVVHICHKYFGDDVIWRNPRRASFPRAFKWCWLNVENPYVLHLEDDWELVKRVDLNDMINILETFPPLALLRLPYKPSGEQAQKNWSHFFPWNGTYFECPSEMKISIGFCGHPSLIKRRFVRTTRDYIDVAKNPEKQFHYNKAIVDEVVKWEFGTYGKPGDKHYVVDIGRQWMIRNNFRKKGPKAFFTMWEAATDG